MGVLKNLTDEYFKQTERKEDAIPYVIRHEFTDKNGTFHKNGYYVENGSETSLNLLIDRLIKERGNEADLNDIDVSNITDMSNLFGIKFDSISGRKIKDAKYDFNGDISGWDTSEVLHMKQMFDGCINFNCDIGKWNVEKVLHMSGMFAGCVNFNQNLSEWDIKSVVLAYKPFEGCPIKDEYKPIFNKLK